MMRKEHSSYVSIIEEYDILSIESLLSILSKSDSTTEILLYYKIEKDPKSMS